MSAAQSQTQQREEWILATLELCYAQFQIHPVNL